MLNNIKMYALGAIGIATLLLIGWLLLSKSWLQADLDAAKRDLVTTTEAYQAQTQALALIKAEALAKERAIAGRDKEIAKIKGRYAKTWRELQGALRNDKDSADWGATRLPDSVRGLLVETTDADQN